jgi:hypothetical protein
MVNALTCLLKKKVTEEAPVRDEETEAIGREIKTVIDAVSTTSPPPSTISSGSGSRLSPPRGTLTSL